MTAIVVDIHSCSSMNCVERSASMRRHPAGRSLATSLAPEPAPALSPPATGASGDAVVIDLAIVRELLRGQL